MIYKMQVPISATIAPDSQAFIEQMAQELKSSKSAILEKAIRLLQQKTLNEKMKAGYLADNKEALDFAHTIEKLTTLWDE